MTARAAHLSRAHCHMAESRELLCDLVFYSSLLSFESLYRVNPIVVYLRIWPPATPNALYVTRLIGTIRNRLGKWRGKGNWITPSELFNLSDDNNVIVEVKAK